MFEFVSQKFEQNFFEQNFNLALSSEIFSPRFSDDWELPKANLPYFVNAQFIVSFTLDFYPNELTKTRKTGCQVDTVNSNNFKKLTCWFMVDSMSDQNNKSSYFEHPSSCICDPFKYLYISNNMIYFFNICCQQPWNHKFSWNSEVLRIAPFLAAHFIYIPWVYFGNNVLKTVK